MTWIGWTLYVTGVIFLFTVNSITTTGKWKSKNTVGIVWDVVQGLIWPIITWITVIRVILKNIKI